MQRDHWLLLAGILLLAFVWRWQGVAWDQYSAGHPDERFVAEITAAMGDADARLSDVQQRCHTTAFWNTACSPYNPNNLSTARFAYGTFPLLVVHQVAVGVARVTDDENWLSERQVPLVGRTVNALTDTVAVLLVFWIARQVVNRRYSLLAAALYAGAVLPLQLSHFYTVDIMANSTFLLLVAFSLRIQRTNARRDYLLAGVAAALASASRANLVVAVVLIPVAASIYLAQHEQVRLGAVLRRIAVGVVLAGGAFFITFRLVQPYAFVAEHPLDVVDTVNLQVPFVHLNWNTDWRNDLEAIAALSSRPVDDWPPSFQWYDRPVYLTPWWNALWGMGAGVWLAGTLGLFAAVRRQLWRQELSPTVGLLSLWCLLYFAWQGQLHVMTMRYFLPLYGVLIVVAIWWLYRLPWLAVRRWGRALILISTLLWAMFFSAIYRQPHTRIQAAVWLYDHTPALLSVERGHHFQPLDVLTGLPGTVRSTLVAVAIEGAVLARENEPVQFLPFSVTVPRQITGLDTYLPHLRGDVQVTAQLFELEQNGERMHWETVLVADGGYFRAQNTLPTLTGGTYRWQFRLEPLSATTQLVYLLPMISYQTDGAAFPQPQSLKIDPATVALLEIPYFYLGPQHPLTIEVNTPLRLQRLHVAHQLGNATSVRLTDPSGEWAFATLDAATAISDVTRLGSSRTYQHDGALPFSPGRYQIEADGGLWIAPTTIATEGRWDTPTPLRTCWHTDAGNRLDFVPFSECTFNSGFDRLWYAELPLPIAEPDTPQKQLQMRAILQVADYLTISSNRMYDALPRHETRYPWIQAYYDALFAERLGFLQQQRFASFPRLGPLVIPDQSLPDDGWPTWLGFLEPEEAFSVYDHPTIDVFENHGFDTRQFERVLTE